MPHVRPSFNGIYEKVLEDQDLRMLRDGSTIYVHCPTELSCSTIKLKPLAETPEKVILMNTGKTLEWTFEPIVYDRNKNEIFLRIRGIDCENLTGPAVIKISFPEK